MSTQGLFSIGGLASGLDTNKIVEQLLSIERQPLDRIEARKESLQQTRAAWGQITTKLSGVRAALDRIATTDDFAAMSKVSSSDPDSVRATSTGTAAEGELTFTVDNLAVAQQYASGDTFDDADTTIGSRTLTITVDGTDHDVTADLASGATLKDLVATINDADIGVTAHALATSSESVQLVLTADETGTANTFTVAGTNWDTAFAETQAAEDAVLFVGGVEVTRSSNTIDDLLEGVEIELVDFPPTSVTVRTSRDVQDAIDDIKEFVRSLNSLLATVATLTDYDSETGKSGALQGQSTASTIAFDLRNALLTPTGHDDGAYQTASDVGISLTRDGLLELDAATLQDALADDFDAVAELFAPSARVGDEAAAYVRSTVDTQAGTYVVDVTTAPERAGIVAASTYAAPASDTTIRITQGSRVAEATILTSDDAATAIERLDTALADAGITTIDAFVTDGALELRDDRYGAAHSFVVEELDGTGTVDPGGTALGLAGSFTGVDVAGTIGGIAATGSGRLLRATDGGASGLALTIGTLPAAPFEVTVSSGLVGNVDLELSRAEGDAGLVSLAQDSIDSLLRLQDQRIEAFEVRLEAREATIRQQFLALEAAIGRMDSQGQWLQQQLAGLGGWGG